MPPRNALPGAFASCLLALGLTAGGALAGPPASHKNLDNAVTSAGEIVPRFLLQDVRGKVFTDQDFRGRFMLIAFGFVSCPDVCPTTMADMAGVLAKLDKRAARVEPIFITVDPERDSHAVLREYTGAFDPRIRGMTGPQELIQRAAQHFRVEYRKVSEPGALPGQYTMDHTAGMFLVGPDGTLAAKFAYGTPVTDVVARINALVDAEPAPSAGVGEQGTR